MSELNKKHNGLLSPASNLNKFLLMLSINLISFIILSHDHMPEHLYAQTDKFYKRKNFQFPKKFQFKLVVWWKEGNCANVVLWITGKMVGRVTDELLMGYCFYV